MTEAILERYGLREIGTIAINQNQFLVSISDEAAVQQERSIYAFLVEDEIVRIGSSKAKLRVRLGEWRRGVSAALQGRKSSTPAKEVQGWRDALEGKVGRIYARAGTTITTPVGEISAYIAEEIALIERHKPKFCRR